jgi:1-acyl-sn-glycerol-3-phosphate acyltransferase
VLALSLPGKSVAEPGLWRGRRRVALIALLLVVHVPLHGLWRLFGRRSPWPTSFLRLAGRAAGADVRVVGTPLRSHVLMATNHLSWLDILVLAGASGARFVAKDEIARWPLFGFLAGLNRTVYIARKKRGEVREQAGQVRQALAEGCPVALFAEGGTGDGEGVKPFRASLFEALLPPVPGIRLQPVAIDYGRDTPALAWDRGISMGSEMMRVLRLPGRRTATIRFLDPIDPLGWADRKALAIEARGRLVAAMGVSSE